MKNVFLIAILCCPVFAVDESTQPVDHQAELKTFKLYTNDGAKEWIATAFVVSSNTLLSAAHPFKKTAKTSRHFILRGGKFEVLRLLKIDFDKDIAVLESDSPFNASYSFAPNSKEPGVVTALGFPWQSRELKAISGRWKKSSKWLDTDRGILDGMSGCPMLNAAGDVIGMGCKGDDTTHSVPCEALSKFLK